MKEFMLKIKSEANHTQRTMKLRCFPKLSSTNNCGKANCSSVYLDVTKNNS